MQEVCPYTLEDMEPLRYVFSAASGRNAYLTAQNVPFSLREKHSDSGAFDVGESVTV
jgi:hypothetical protein